jgi:hypothetical protein
MRTCEVCDAILKKQKRYCSKKCYAKAATGVALSEDRKNTMRGRKLSRETVMKQNAAKKRDRFRKVGTYPCSLCSKIFDSNTGLRSHMSYCTYADKNGEAKPEDCQLCGKTLSSGRALKIHQKLKHAPADVKEERSRKLSLSHCNVPFRKESLEEIAFFEKVREIYGDAVRSFMIEGSSHVYDVFVPSLNLLIEYDGDYYHGNPKFHALTDRMKKQYCLDMQHARRAESFGYSIARVWASESEDFIDCLRSARPCLTLRTLV